MDNMLDGHKKNLHAVTYDDISPKIIKFAQPNGDNKFHSSFD